MNAKSVLSVISVYLASLALSYAQLQSDILPSKTGDLKITFIGHASLMFTYGGKVVHVDPWGRLTDYSKLPKADLILITHDHIDHLDAATIKTLRTSSTLMVVSPACTNQVKGGIVITKGCLRTPRNIWVESVPAYNVVHKMDNGAPYHPKGSGCGYILTFDNQRVYIAGDTEDTPEMKALKGIDVAFLPMNLPYTMTPEMVADATRAFKPKILYPYHFGETDTAKLTTLLKDTPGTEIRIRNMK